MSSSRYAAVVVVACLVVTGDALLAARKTSLKKTVTAAELVVQDNEGVALTQTKIGAISFEPLGTLLRRTVPVGLLYRDTLVRMSGLMLPHPDFFEAAHAEALAQQKDAKKDEEWWREVTRATYSKVMTDFPYDEDEVAEFDDLFEDLFTELHTEVLVSPIAWELAPGARRLLDGLIQWRDMGGGPKIGLVTDSDERIATIFEKVVSPDALRSFDFVAHAGPEAIDAFEMHGVAESACVHVTPRQRRPSVGIKEAYAFDLPPRPIMPKAAREHPSGYKVLECVDLDAPMDPDATQTYDLRELLFYFDLPTTDADKVITMTRVYSETDDDFAHEF